MRSKPNSYETKQCSSQKASTETRGLLRLWLHLLSTQRFPHIKPEGRNASFFGPDIVFTVGEPAQGKAALFSTFDGLV